ncbi:AbrB/MazE/SpoVT family DNA-binding domain-containing protein [Pleurocapsa sp. PCC 7319]|uniref:AbrB/MazE/SpoVT family DNA-binding domain-containing protein n=1 Tax=Pleurocapsa sp. PCC 7319 TaxID=118161 RepID=UPI00034890D0|nr:AbrB/MazE/SpoVT family DNA-binding domain-containing protein [Pleurocapsa sp. PCC 7319]
MYKIKIRKVGNSLGATIPKEVLEKLRVEEGDTVFVTETPDGVKLSAYDPEFEKAMSIYKKGSHKYRNAMKELA